MSEPRPILHQRRALIGIGSGLAAGVVVWLASQGRASEVMRVILGFDAGALTYLALAWLHLIRAGEGLSAAQEEDQGHLALTAVVIAAVVAGLGGVGVLVKGAHSVDRLAVAVATIMLAWLLVQTIFAAHYANAYRVGLGNDPDRPGLDFPGGGPIRFLDFAYLAFTVGLTFQVSDVTTNTAAMRRLVMAQAVIAFLFNTSVIAIGVGAATAWF